MMKDLFSNQAAEYSKYRPTYPQELFDFIFSHVQQFNTAWDCATGNGQTAVVLAEKFKQVVATDQSTAQLKYAPERSNITYSACSAEKTNFADKSFDLVTVSQALHWFDFDPFYLELKRVLKPTGIFAAWCYSLMKIDSEIDPIIKDFYSRILGPYWDERRELVNKNYQTIPFPLSKIKTPPFKITREWTLDELINYFTTWSSVQTYIQKNGSNPTDLMLANLHRVWRNPSEPKTMTWPVFMLLGSF